MAKRRDQKIDRIFKSKNPKVLSGSFKGENFEKLCEILQESNPEDGVVIFLSKDKKGKKGRPFYVGIVQGRPGK